MPKVVNGPQDFAPLNEVVEAAGRSSADAVAEYIKSAQESLASRISQYESSRFAVQAILGLGLNAEIETNSYGPAGEYIWVTLPPALGAKGKKQNQESLAEIAKVLGCHLEKYNVEVHDKVKKTVLVTLQPRDFPGVRVCHVAKLKQSDSCKIVRRVEKSSKCVQYRVECSV